MTAIHTVINLLIHSLYKYGAMTVRDAQHAILSLGYSKEDLLRNCPKAPDGVEIDPSIRRMKGVLTHPIGDYAGKCLWSILPNRYIIL